MKNCKINMTNRCQIKGVILSLQQNKSDIWIISGKGRSRHD